ncbi:acyl-CoA dehydrogenase [Salipiger sp.]|uniref:acyl-CoA dehydrogenase n=1 Tax=Salipiger sp. TaxID=2078585 RepID=UPI003A96CFAB
MTYVAPVQDMRFVLQDLCDLDEIAALPGYEDVTVDTVVAILDEAAKYAGQVLSPLNRAGDQHGARIEDGRVTTAPGWTEAYATLVEMGWNSPAARPEHGGMGLPNLVNACIQEIFQGANMAFQLCPMLTQGAIEALELYGSERLGETFLPRLVSGEWTGTMNLTEPQAGSDLSAIRARAVPRDDHFLVSGQKIFITYGEHDLAENIVHLVLARLPDAPEGVKGISLFVVPKMLVNADGTLGERNDVRCVSIEHKLGIHGSPTCTLSFGDNGGATGFLVGEAHRGLEYMFAMMNNARLSVGLQGIGVSEHACQDALRYATGRLQGRAPGHDGPAPILAHTDVRRMLAQMQARTRAARILAYRAARSLDLAAHAPDADRRALHRRRVDLLIPVVKGWSTDGAIGVTSLGVQIHGGMGYVEETGAAQHFRDARIASIYEGTTGIQALDLVGRKILRDEGRAVAELVAEIRESASALASVQSDLADWPMLGGSVRNAADLLSQTTDWLLSAGDSRSERIAAAAANTLEVFGLALGMWCHGDAALATARRIADGDSSRQAVARIRLAEFYALQIFPDAAARNEALVSGSDALLSLTPDCLGADPA